MPLAVEDDKKWLAEFLEKRHKEKKPPETSEERRLLAGFYGYRGRQEIDALCGVSAYALRNFQLDYKWKSFLSEHIGEEAEHGVHYIKAGDQLYPEEKHWLESTEWEGTYGHWRQWIFPIAERGLPGFIVGLLLQVEGYGTLTAPIYSQWDVPEVINWRLNEQLAEEDEHEEFFVKAIHGLLDRCSSGERQEMIELIRGYEQECMRTGYLGNERLHYDLFIKRLHFSTEQYGRPLYWRRVRIWHEWFGCEAPKIEWPAWMAKAGINPEA